MIQTILTVSVSTITGSVIGYCISTIKKYKAKWGACTPSKKKVSFNMNLIKTPVECLEYVVVHELAHFKYLNHSQKFYKLIEKYIPDWKYRKKLLNEKYGRVLI